jgi:hypothetical protein
MARRKRLEDAVTGPARHPSTLVGLVPRLGDHGQTVQMMEFISIIGGTVLAGTAAMQLLITG